jgi:transcriptional regulator with XRE-family HTH domain
MPPISEEQKSQVISLLKARELDTDQIAEKVGISPGSVRSYRANFTMGRYDDLPSEQVIEALDTTFGLERDLQLALRSNIQQLEQGLTIIDDGREQSTEAGRIDITAKDQQGAIVIIELKAGTAPSDSVTQILSYMGAISERENTPVRGILIAGDFSPRVIFAARAVPNLELRRYSFRFTFGEVK